MHMYEVVMYSLVIFLFTDSDGRKERFQTKLGGGLIHTIF